jgi:hypothetical protein
MSPSLPFSIEAVRRICSVTPTRPLQECPVCSRIPDYAVRHEKGGTVERDNVPPEVKHLRFFLDYGPDVGVAHVAQCPECSRLYNCRHEYEFLIGGSEDTESYERVAADDIVKMEFWAYLKGAAELRPDGGAWQVVVEGRRNHRKF